MRVAVLAGAKDPQGRRVLEELRARKADAFRFDAGAFPERGRLSVVDGRIRLDGREEDAPAAAYVRGLGCHPLAAGFEDDLAVRPRGLIAQCDEKRGVLESVLLLWRRAGTRLVNGLEANELHGRKPLQAALLRAGGIPTPRSVATNDPRAVRRFVREVGEVVYKPVAGGATVRRLLPEDLAPERLSALSAAPVLFEEYVAGNPVRAYVVGGRVVAAAEIRSADLDYRRAGASIEPTRLTSEERRAVLRAARLCGMDFAGVDVIRGADGFVVLECNPSPMFAAFESATGADVAGPLAALLAGRGAQR